MIRVTGVRFHGVGKAYDFALNDITVNPGDPVVVESVRGLELGFCADSGKEREEDQLILPLRPVLRPATAEDLEIYTENTELEKEAYIIGRDKIREHELKMTLVDVEYLLDRQKIIFFFTADDRIDFRNLVKDLASVFHRRIELRQIGVRDEARMAGGCGICGRELCCSSWLSDFVPVSVKMAKMQSLSMNPAKISGCCGRLMCCLKYEQDQYEEARRIAPRLNSVVETPRGRAVVMQLHLLEEEAVVRLEQDDSDDLFRYSFDELNYDHPPRREQLPICRSAHGGCQGCGARRNPPAGTAAAVPAPPDAALPAAAPAAESDLPAAAAPAAGDRPAQTAARPQPRTRRVGRPQTAGFIPHPVDPADLPQN
ncbi:MAG: stage 0 sporulation family protein [Oscillospiraceae bacterium]|nr:stage 0 sporulation family protein [Oscillospiraceae bacterium]MDD4368306.1 stage 0 sporulation family protein [Oscillospiraceae bacterium]